MKQNTFMESDSAKFILIDTRFEFAEKYPFGAPNRVSEVWELNPYRIPLKNFNLRIGRSKK